MYAPQKNRVLFVDDEEPVRQSWDRFLSARGFAVTTAEDGNRAIARLRDQPVDVVIADWRMPNVDGLELLQWVHDSQPTTPFIMLTGWGNEEVERKARELGAYGYLNKPISPETLSALVTAAIHLKMLPATEPKALAPPAAKARARKRETLKIVGSLIAAPVLSLAFVLFLPAIAFFFLFRVLAEAIQKRLAGAKA